LGDFCQSSEGSSTVRADHDTKDLRKKSLGSVVGEPRGKWVSFYSTLNR